MVRAIYAGRKTQTRRLVKKENEPDSGFNWRECLCREIDPSDTPCVTCAVRFGDSPHGAPGDRLWVRETWCVPPNYDAVKPRDLHPLTPVRYAAEGAVRGVSKRFVDADGRIMLGRQRSSLHMPRWASRITLEVTGVRVERLQDISEADAIAEGLERSPVIDAWRWSGPNSSGGATYPRSAFEELWKDINGPDSWDANPWVFAISFRRMLVEEQ